MSTKLTLSLNGLTRKIKANGKTNLYLELNAHLCELLTECEKQQTTKKEQTVV